MEFQIPDFYPALTEIFLSSAALLILLIVSFVRQGAGQVAYKLSQVSLIIAAVLAASPILINIDFGLMFGGESWTLDGAGITFGQQCATSGKMCFTFGQMFVNDGLAIVLKPLALIAVSLSLLYGRRYVSDRRLDTAEYYLLVLFSALGILVMISAGSLLTIYLGLEMLSLSSYALVAINRDSVQSTEAGMKYFVLGALASGLLLYGISMVYGATQTLNIIDVARALVEQQANNTIMVFGMVFVVAGVAFKLGAAPFHMWIPDVYQGAPTSVTLLLGAAPKLAAFAMAFRMIAIAFWAFAEQWQHMLMLLAAASIVLGNVAAIAQTNIKRMLAYSAISHMGFMLLGLTSGVVNGDSYHAGNAYAASLFYVVTYVLTTLAAFGILMLMTRSGFEAENIDDFKGLNRRSSWWAGMMAVVMFSMAGIPFFVGFFAKFLVLQFVVATDHLWLAVLAVMMSLVGAFYYLRVVKLMFFDEPVETAPIMGGIGVKIALSLNVLMLAVLGLFPHLSMSILSIVMNGSF
ncbi:NADH-quinone oxidoreductase subunit NuoN [Viridibacterium curvum]|uniref:NADH-quinone oxidoreductase subunit N n=1 Tax=Viridibacterium curvum TaxID=1101404 RepID=A0ABP9Q8Z7_9RHOO